MDFSTALRDTMTELGLRPADVASAVRTTEATIYRYLNGGDSPKYDTLVRFCTAYPTLAQRVGDILKSGSAA